MAIANENGQGTHLGSSSEATRGCSKISRTMHRTVKSLEILTKFVMEQEVKGEFRNWGKQLPRRMCSCVQYHFRLQPPLFQGPVVYGAAKNYPRMSRRRVITREEPPQFGSNRTRENVAIKQFHPHLLGVEPVIINQ